MTSPLFNKMVLVTGAAAGLGRALAIEAAHRGARLVLVDLNDATDTAVHIREFGGQAETFQVDVSVHADMEALARKVEETHGAINVLVNNAAAAGGGAGTLETADPVAVKRMFEVNVYGVFNGIHVFARLLRRAVEEGGPAYIFNVGSEHSLGVPPHVQPISAYTASKYAILGLTDTARRDFAPSGIKVSLLAPGWILTERIQEMIESSPERAKLIEPYAQLPQEVARLAWDGLLNDREIVPTNPATREFAIEHARALMLAAQQLPKQALQLGQEDPHGGGGEFSRCPMSQIHSAAADLRNEQ